MWDAYKRLFTSEGYSTAETFSTKVYSQHPGKNEINVSRNIHTLFSTQSIALVSKAGMVCSRRVGVCTDGGRESTGTQPRLLDYIHYSVLYLHPVTWLHFHLRWCPKCNIKRFWRHFRPCVCTRWRLAQLSSPQRLACMTSFCVWRHSMYYVILCMMSFYVWRPTSS